MSPAKLPEITFGDVRRALCRQSGKIVSVLAFAGTVTVLAILFLPRQFVSESQLYVRVGRENLTLDPTMTGQTMSLQYSRDREVNSVVEMLKSRGILQTVTEEIGVDRILDEPTRPATLTNLRLSLKNQISAFRQHLLGKADETEVAHGRLEQAMDRIERSLRVAAAVDAETVKITCSAQTPELARDILGSLLRVYKTEHMRVHRSTGAEEFFDEQTRMFREKLAATQGELRDVKSRMNIASIEGQQLLLEQEKVALAVQRMENQREVEAARSRLASITGTLDNLPDTVLLSRTEGIASVAADQMRSQLYDLEMRHREAMAKYDESHPAVQVISQQIEYLREIQQREEAKSRSQSQVAVNPNRQAVELQLVTEQAAIAGREAAQSALDKQYDSVLAELRELNNYAVAVKELQREAELHEKSYRAYVDSHEQARIDLALRDGGITNVAVIHPPTLTFEPATPKTWMLAAIGLLIGVAGALAVAVIGEQLDDRFRTPSQVEEILSIPVLISVPRSSQHMVKV